VKTNEKIEESRILWYIYTIFIHRKERGLAMDEKRLESFEKMLKAILSQYDSTVEKMAKLKAEGKEKTVTYRQLFANKLQLQAMLSYYRTYGLL
jgi:hypothetical protein